MPGYTKLFSSILDSTIWRERDHVRLVWITLMAMADRDGVAEASLPGLADRARVTLDHATDAVAVLQQPDKYSRSKDFDGRRIAEIDGGWLLLNYDKYRQQLSADDRREYLRRKQAEYRTRKKVSTNVSDSHLQINNVDTSRGRSKSRYRSKEEKEESKLAAGSKRPIYTSDRFAVFEWQLDELCAMLGPFAEDFDLHAFFNSLSQSPIVIPATREDRWAWLKAQVEAEARRRGLPIAGKPTYEEQLKEISKGGPSKRPYET